MSALKRLGFSIRYIVSYLGRHRSSIYREFARNTYHADGWYRPSKAQEKNQFASSIGSINTLFTQSPFIQTESNPAFS